MDGCTFGLVQLGTSNLDTFDTLINWKRPIMTPNHSTFSLVCLWLLIGQSTLTCPIEYVNHNFHFHFIQRLVCLWFLIIGQSSKNYPQQNPLSPPQVNMRFFKIKCSHNFQDNSDANICCLFRPGDLPHMHQVSSSLYLINQIEIERRKKHFKHFKNFRTCTKWAAPCIWFLILYIFMLKNPIKIKIQS